MRNEVIVSGLIKVIVITVLTLESSFSDSLLVPLVIDTNTNIASAPYGVAPIRTYLNIKIKGKSGFNSLGSPEARLHYTWIKKGSTASSLSLLNKPCTMVDNEGRGTRNDMLFQQTRGDASPFGSPANNSTPDGIMLNDASWSNTHGNNDFVGMLVVTDVAHSKKRGAPSEGGLSGFGYIVNAAGDIIEYKLINNHHSTEDGNFNAGYISAKVVDFAWMQNTNTSTNWLVIATGSDMAKHSRPFNSSYDATILLTQKVHPDGTQDDPKNISDGIAGVYNNDEGFTSYDPAVRVTCMGLFDKTILLGNDPLLLSNTNNGGWMRMSVSPAVRLTNSLAQTYTDANHKASGALVYRDDIIAGKHTLQIETSGHLAKNNNHANRPY